VARDQNGHHGKAGNHEQAAFAAEIFGCERRAGFGQLKAKLLIFTQS
jgi:hypothetical protein